MPTPFAELEQRMDDSIQSRMPNAVAVHVPSGASADVIFTAEGEVIDTQGVVTVRPEILIRAGAWPSMTPGDPVTIDGAPYELRSPEAAHGGAWQRIPLAKG